MFHYVYVLFVYMSYRMYLSIACKIYYVYVLFVCIYSTPEVYSEITLVWWGVKNDKLAKELVREWHSVQFRPNFIRWRPFDGMEIGNCSQWGGSGRLD